MRPGKASSIPRLGHPRFAPNHWLDSIFASCDAAVVTASFGRATTCAVGRPPSVDLDVPSHRRQDHFGDLCYGVGMRSLLIPPWAAPRCAGPRGLSIFWVWRNEA